MPKLRKSVEDRANESMRAYIKSSLMLERGTDEYKELAPMLGIHANTVYVRVHEPESFRLGEMRRMFNTLHWTNDQILAVFGRAERSIGACQKT